MTQKVLGPTGSRRRRRMLLFPALLVLAAAVVFGVTSAVGASLTGSNFEIDTNANLVLDGSAPSVDWATLSHAAGGPEIRKQDLATGQTDDSYAGGSKEDDVCPGTGTGSIPNNKSDLLFFGVYVEAGAPGSAGFLNLFWSRVSEPSGTTLMDFEFNKSQTGCGNGVNPVRTAGDLLIEYRIEQGGASATLKVREWTGSAWGAAVDLGSNDAIGTINTSPITNANSDGLGAMNARTFGEASINLDAIFEEGKCESFGSAFLKSRASDSFTSQMKDFIAPVPVSITNCGSVLVKKTAQGTGALLSGATFTIAPGQVDAQGQEAQSSTIPESTTKPGYYCIQDILIDGANETHRITETVAPAGYDPPSPAFQDVQVTSTRTCAQRLADTTITPDATFVDPPQVGAIAITKTAKHKGPAGSANLVAGFTITDSAGATHTTTTSAAGTACVGNLPLGSALVSETTVPTGYRAPSDVTVTVVNGTCASGAVAAGFVNTPLSNITVSFTSQVTGGTAAKISCGQANNPTDSTPNAYDDTSETSTNLVPGVYTCTVDIDP